METIDWLIEQIAQASSEDALRYWMKMFAEDLARGHFQDPSHRIRVRWAIRVRRYFLRSALTAREDSDSLRARQAREASPAWQSEWGPEPERNLQC